MNVTTSKRYMGPVLLTSAITGALSMGFVGIAQASELGVGKAEAAVNAGLNIPVVASSVDTVPTASDVINANVPTISGNGTAVSTGGGQQTPVAGGNLGGAQSNGFESETLGEEDVEPGSSEPGSEVPGEEVPGSETTETPGEGGSEAGGAGSETEGEAPGDGGPGADGADAGTPGAEGAGSDAPAQTVTEAPSLSASVAATSEPQVGEAAEKEPYPATGWVVEDRGDGLQRYYVSGGETLKGLFEAVIDGVSSWFYGREDLGGAVVRGKWDNGRGRVYLADNDGRLAEVACGSGWLVTDAYDGELQRYYIDGAAHAAVSGYFSTDAYGRLGSEGALDRDHFGLGGEGYVLRGAGSGVRSDRILADNDGRLAEGWVVTDVFGQGLQRYWFDSEGVMATGRLVGATEGDASGWYAYALSDGRILRGGATVEGNRYLADNDGRLSTNCWVITGAFTGGALERYYAGSDGAFLKSGLFRASDGTWAYAKSDTSILRTRLKVGDLVYLADNDGRLAGPGWVLSDKYGQGLQRYWVDSQAHAAKVGFFVANDGKTYYTTENGYVLRGVKSFGSSAAGKIVQVADNDGKLIENFASNAGWLVTGAMTNGTLQRYYLVDTDGHLFARVDLFEADLAGKKSSFYGNASTGYVSRNQVLSVNGKTYRSDNDGRLIVAAVRVYLDSGHGASGSFDPGSSGSGYQEYKLTEELVNMIASILQNKYGIEVVKHGNTNYSDRQDEASANNCDFLVSIHFNAGGGTGSESYIHTIHAAPGSEELQDIMHKYLVEGLGLADRGQKEEQFAVVGGKVPGVLLEVCFIDNANDMAQYQARKQTLAEKLAAGIAEFAQKIS
ncbi:N-acetylmuramoyl-L-alanine amidase [Thermophilibacter provencensis]|uniref:N-acetylmuramoyl-L-alanine amidase n=1 Tax=Thermophilibacter provencensis TaxID=1852386 RepID=UPI000B33626D|nr:N-acetylmuramoyl-L-alanine amidase [Thermophilibacter provencensis]